MILPAVTAAFILSVGTMMVCLLSICLTAYLTQYAHPHKFGCPTP